MAQNEDESSSFEPSDSQPSATLVNEIWVPLLKCKSNYDAWRAKLEEAVSTKDPASWRILTGDLSDPFDHIDTILSRQSFARSGMAKRQDRSRVCHRGTSDRLSPEAIASPRRLRACCERGMD